MVAVATNTSSIIMGRPRLYATEEERRAAMKASYQKHNLTHREARAAHNKAYCQREDVKQRRRENRVARALALRTSNGTHETNVQNTGEE